MILDEFINYSSQYEQGIKRISFRSTYLKVMKDPIELKMEKTQGNYDLVFSQRGILLHSVHFDRRHNYKIIYGYNNSRNLIVAMQLLSEKNELISVSEFTYDSIQRIETEMIRKFDSCSNLVITEEHIHKYLENKEELNMTSDNEDENDHIIYYTFDGENRIIEERAIRNSDELVWWHKNEYDKEGNIIKEISLDESGHPDGISEYFHYDNGLTSGYIYKSSTLNYKREISSTLNERGHWTNQIILIDGEPRFNYERTIEYY